GRDSISNQASFLIAGDKYFSQTVLAAYITETGPQSSLTLSSKIIFTNQGIVIPFNNPQVNVFLATKQLTEMLPSTKLGADSLTSLRRLAEALPKKHKSRPDKSRFRKKKWEKDQRTNRTIRAGVCLAGWPQ
uniref:Uncharacterized protein n=1 Tax=Hucho hucho TaxID=62062 RepID=A0A4W5NU56_9TELE